MHKTNNQNQYLWTYNLNMKAQCFAHAYNRHNLNSRFTTISNQSYLLLTKKERSLWYNMISQWQSIKTININITMSNIFSCSVISVSVYKTRKAK